MKKMIQVGMVALAVFLLTVGDAWPAAESWRRRRRLARWWRREPPESVGEPFAFGQSRIAVHQPALDTGGQSSSAGTRPAPAPARARAACLAPVPVPAQAPVPARAACPAPAPVPARGSALAW